MTIYTQQEIERYKWPWSEFRYLGDFMHTSDAARYALAVYHLKLYYE